MTPRGSVELRYQTVIMNVSFISPRTFRLVFYYKNLYLLLYKFKQLSTHKICVLDTVEAV